VGNGADHRRLSQSAALLYQGRGNLAGLFRRCTGLNANHNVVLTAEHCVSGSTPRAVYFQHAGKPTKIQDISVRAYKTYVFPNGDVALVYLGGLRPSGSAPISPQHQGARCRSIRCAVVWLMVISRRRHLLRRVRLTPTRDSKEAGIKSMPNVNRRGNVRNRAWQTNKRFICWN